MVGTIKLRMKQMILTLYVNPTTNADKTTICSFDWFNSILYSGKTFNP